MAPPVDIWGLAFVLFELSDIELEDMEPYPGQLALIKEWWSRDLAALAKRLGMHFVRETKRLARRLLQRAKK